MLTVLCPEAAKLKFEQHAQDTSIPWALMKDSFTDFANKLRADGIFLVEATGDDDTANRLQEALRGRSSVLIGPLLIHNLEHTNVEMDVIGKKHFKTIWMFASKSILVFLEYLFRHNVFLAFCEESAVKMLNEKTALQNVNFRLKQPEGVNANGTNL